MSLESERPAGRHLPAIIVFDLDGTLWDCGGSWCDCLSPPFVKRDGRVLDSRGDHIRLFSDVRRILEYCREHDIDMALASRTDEPDWARQLLRLLGIARLFRHSQIFPGSKFTHFCNIRRESDVAYKEMLFFDDETRNIREISRLQVTCNFVTGGLDWHSFLAGLHEFAKSNRRRASG